MFTVQKASTLSQVPSVESLATDPSVTTTNSDTWLSIPSEASSFVTIPSPEDHLRVNVVKRTSLFSRRARSNTATSTTSPLAAMMNSTSPSSAASRRSQEVDVRIDQRGNHRSLFRSRRPDRAETPLPFSGSNDLQSNQAEEKRTSILRRKRSNVPSGLAVTDLKSRISQPFDFKHLTHTDRQQFASLQKTSQTELVSVFRAVSTSQTPSRGLTGIQAEDIGPSSPRSASALSWRSSPIYANPTEMPVRPARPAGALPASPLRSSRSVESFSQPTFARRTHRHTQSVSLDPQLMPQPQLHAMQGGHGTANSPSEHERPVLSPMEKRQPILSESRQPPIPYRPGLHSPVSPELGDVGHAFTTPDNIAIHTTTPPFSPGLEDVSEEPERFISPRAAPPPPRRATEAETASVIPLAAPTDRSTSNTRLPMRKSSVSSPKSFGQRRVQSQPPSLIPEAHNIASTPEALHGSKSGSPKRTSNTWRVIEASWEDDIDYIYENALEADCDFEWDRSSTGGDSPSENRTLTPCEHPGPVHVPSEASGSPSSAHRRMSSSALRPVLLVPHVDPASEVDLNSATSISTFDASIATPSDPMPTHALGPIIKDTESFMSSTPLLFSDAYKDEIGHNGAYGGLLAHYETSERHFPLFDSTQSATSSTRSSHIRSSKSSSFEISTISTRQRSASWSSGLRRSASSTGSVPELVHSSRNARGKADGSIEHLAEPVASASIMDEVSDVEDDDLTPPARRPASQAVPTSMVAQSNSAITEEALPEGTGDDAPTSAPTTHRHHRYALSDGADKMLAFTARTRDQPDAIQGRTRAASSRSSKPPTRTQYLDLFPKPPRRSTFALSPR